MLRPILLALGVLLFVSNGVVATETQITSESASDQRPAWSPDGNQIVFDSNRAGNRDLWLVSPTGGLATQLTFNVLIDQHPDWSPSSSTISLKKAASRGFANMRWLRARSWRCDRSLRTRPNACRSS